jgi:hypothetical protein
VIKGVIKFNSSNMSPCFSFKLSFLNETFEGFVDMFTGKVCLSLMARTIVTMVCLLKIKEAMRKATMMEKKESISSGEEANSMKIKAHEE